MISLTENRYLSRVFSSPVIPWRFLCWQGISVWNAEQFNIVPLTFENWTSYFQRIKVMKFIQVVKMVQKYFSWNYLIFLFVQLLKLYAPKTSKLQIQFKILHRAYCTSKGNNTFNNCSWSNVSSLTAISNNSKGSVSSFFEENQHIIKHHWKQQKSLHTFNSSIKGN